MNEIEVLIQTRDGQRELFRLPQDVPAGQIAADLRDMLNLPIYDRHQREYSYVFFDCVAGRFLNNELSLNGGGVRPEARLRILPRAFVPQFELELETEPNPGMLYAVQPREVAIGREFGNNIVIRHKVVSRKHGLFHWMDGFHVYLDLGSANGSWVNDHPVTELTPIVDGDVLSLGRGVRLTYRERFDAQPSAAEEADAVIGHMRMLDSHTSLVQMGKHKIYVSYSPGERVLVDLLVGGLMLHKFSVYRHAQPGDGTLDEVDAVVVVLSPESIHSDLVTEEWYPAWRAGQPVIPVLVEPCPIPEELSDSPYLIRYHGDDRQLVQDIVDTASSALT